MLTFFSPAQHGYKFRNDFQGPFPALCGGMSFGSLDYYYNGLEIPQVAQAPVSGDPIYDYILRRQLDAHAVAIPILVEGRSMWGTNSRSTAVSRAYAAEKNWVDRGSPMPILLGDLDNPLSTNSHWVVAVGYRDGDAGTCGQIDLYDNNYPNQNCWIRPSDNPDTRAYFQHNRTTHRYGFYVPHLHYRPLDPRRHRGPGWALAGAEPIESI